MMQSFVATDDDSAFETVGDFVTAEAHGETYLQELHVQHQQPMEGCYYADVYGNIFIHAATLHAPDGVFIPYTQSQEDAFGYGDPEPTWTNPCHSHHVEFDLSAALEERQCPDSLEGTSAAMPHIPYGESCINGYESDNMQNFDPTYNDPQYDESYASLAEQVPSHAHENPRRNKHGPDESALQLEEPHAFKCEETDALTQLNEVFNLEALVLPPLSPTAVECSSGTDHTRTYTTQLLNQTLYNVPISETTQHADLPILAVDDSPITGGFDSPKQVLLHVPPSEVDRPTNTADDASDPIEHVVSARSSHYDNATFTLGDMVYSPRSMEPLSGASVASPTPAGPKQKRPTKRLTAVACCFCRKRKIACGGPVGKGGSSMQCFQCARRNQQCEYPVHHCGN